MGLGVEIGARRRQTDNAVVVSLREKRVYDADASDPAALDTDASGAGEADLADDADEELDRPPAGAKADLYEGLHDGPVDGDDIDDGPVDKDDV